ncbi:DUF805 domain-containing protein [Sagittula sp. NFXS13]|uniref:DUF805 domain-containing protein n=1 Tax=Sagittula sp. NFXS13 TaxID=2819095 RepID=UPI0032DF14F8
MDTTAEMATAGRNYQEDVSFQEALTRFFQNYIVFEGRANRGEYWKAWLGCFAGSIVFSLVDFMLGIGVLSGLWSLAIIVPSLSIGARRLHDIDKSGWWLLIGLIPLIGAIILIVWFAKKPDPAPNRFG